MSNDIILSIKNELSQIELGLDDDTRAVAGHSGNTTKRISIRAGVFRKYVGGKEIGAIEDRFMNVIFVKMAHGPSRTLYANAYKEGETAAPICWSTDSKNPDPEVKNPKSNRCDNCQYSIKGSSQSGTTSACRLTWRTAVVLPQDPAGDVMQLIIPAKSIWGDEVDGKRPFRPYIQFLANHDIRASRVITRMAFDTNSSAPKLVFSPVGATPPSDLPSVNEQAKSAAAENAVKLNVYQSDTATVEVEAAAPTIVEESDNSKPITFVESDKPKPAEEPKVADLVKKWAKKDK